MVAWNEELTYIPEDIKWHLPPTPQFTLYVLEHSYTPPGKSPSLPKAQSKEGEV